MLSETRQALERAADLLMDHGVIRTGAELERVCEQIRSLRLRKEVGFDDFVVAQSNFPRDYLIGALRGMGIPAIPNPKAHNMDFVKSIAVEYGRLHYMMDFEKRVHRFVWDDIQ